MNLPPQLQQDAIQFAQQQGISLDQFIVWAVAEKVGTLKHQADLQAFPDIAIRSSTSGILTPIIKDTNIRVQTIAIAHTRWQQSASEIADEYGLTETQVQSALKFYETHRAEIDAAIAAEQAIESAVEDLSVTEDGIRRTEQRLHGFEEKFQLFTSEFLRLYENDEYQETLELDEWVEESRMLQRLQDKAEQLRGIEFAN